MTDIEREDIRIDQLKTRIQNLKVLLEEAVLKGSHHRMKELLADIKNAEDEIRRNLGNPGTG